MPISINFCCKSLGISWIDVRPVFLSPSGFLSLLGLSPGLSFPPPVPASPDPSSALHKNDG